MHLEKSSNESSCIFGLLKQSHSHGVSKKLSPAFDVKTENILLLSSLGSDAQPVRLGCICFSKTTILFKMVGQPSQKETSSWRLNQASHYAVDDYHNKHLLYKYSVSSPRWAATRNPQSNCTALIQGLVWCRTELALCSVLLRKLLLKPGSWSQVFQQEMQSVPCFKLGIIHTEIPDVEKSCCLLTSNFCLLCQNKLEHSPKGLEF